MDTLKRAREASGIPAVRMSLFLGVSQPTMSKIEANIENARIRDVKHVYEFVNDFGKEIIRDDLASFFQK